MLRCFAYSFPFAFDLRKLSTHLARNFLVTKFDAVFHFNYKVNNNNADQLDKEGDVFCFDYGAIVSWGLTETEERDLIKLLGPCLSQRLGDIDDDKYTYSYGTDALMKEDHLILPNNSIFTKLACSHGLAQSAKLGGFENTIDNTLELAGTLAHRLAQKGEVNLSKKEIRRLMGKIFVDRYSINLHLDFLNTPNFFWDHTELEPLHEMIVNYMSQSQRVNVINQRLVVMQELLDLLATELNHQHSSKLEWIIIILIFVEVIFSFMKELKTALF